MQRSLRWMSECLVSPILALFCLGSRAYSRIRARTRGSPRACMNDIDFVKEVYKFACTIAVSCVCTS